MKTGLRLLLVLSIVSGLLRCGKTPTEPISAFEATPAPTRTQVPTPGPTPAPGQLSGDWAGTYVDTGCSENVQASIAHQGEQVYAIFESRCVVVGEMRYVEFYGTLRGSTLAGALSTNDTEYAFPRGSASPTTIVLSSSGSHPTSLHLSR